MKDDPDGLLKTNGKFRAKNIDPDGCLKIKELCQYWVFADKLLKGSIVSARFPVKRLQSSLIPDKNRSICP